jgi:hypothetical protein
VATGKASKGFPPDLVIRFPDDQFAVIPGRAEGANPESSHELSRRRWIPGPALRAVPE